VIIAVAILIKPGEATPRIDFQKAGKATPISGPLPTLAIWIRDTKTILRNARQPVSPIGYSDLSARASRGIKVAGVMVVLALMLVVRWVNDGNWALVVIVLALLPFAAIGGVMSLTHTFVLRWLPYRGPIVSTALGTLLGLAAAYVLRDAMMPRPGLVFAGVIYGAIIGFIDFSIAQEKAEQSQAPTR
jgi:hypothetical protein